jgi:ATP-dependent DNA helicase RecQ
MVAATSFAVPSLDAVLRERFGLEALHAWQREAIEHLLGESAHPAGAGSGGSPAWRAVLVVAPTGGGKSLTYQLPATVLEGTTLVLCPLVALMEDQVRALDARGVPATFLASTLEAPIRHQREANMLHGRYKLVYAAPERLASDAFVTLLERCNLALVAVDEAHCIAHWGHDFRPDYLRIGELIARLHPPRILACTATATPEVRREIREQLGLGPHAREILRGFARPNLHLGARSVDGPREAKEALFAALARALGPPDRGTRSGAGASPRGGAIVYAATRRSAVTYAAALRERGWNAAHYHAGESAEERTRVASRFAEGALTVVSATNAFGMGIDRPDIRAVVHVQPPASIEAYYQEVGRAGRDGGEAHGLLLCSGSDIALRRRLAQLGQDGAEPDPQLAARAWKLFRELLRYLDARSCRHDFVLRYFGDEQELLGGCGHCDVCEELDGGEDDPAAAEDATLIVRKALSGVARARQRAGILAIAEMLQGAATERTHRFGFDRLSTFGLLSDRSHGWIVALLRAMLAAGWIDLTPTEHPVPFLTRAGGAVMRAEEPARLILPRDDHESPRKRPAPGRRASPKLTLDPSLQPLFERLRAHRAEVARTQAVPPYVVAPDRTLVELATFRPRNRDELGMIHGLGPHRIDRYGDGFLAILVQARDG